MKILGSCPVTVIYRVTAIYRAIIYWSDCSNTTALFILWDSGSVIWDWMMPGTLCCTHSFNKTGRAPGFSALSLKQKKFSGQKEAENSNTSELIWNWFCFCSLITCPSVSNDVNACINKYNLSTTFYYTLTDISVYCFGLNWSR